MSEHFVFVRPKPPWSQDFLKFHFFCSPSFELHLHMRRFYTHNQKTWSYCNRTDILPRDVLWGFESSLLLICEQLHWMADVSGIFVATTFISDFLLGFKTDTEICGQQWPRCLRCDHLKFDILSFHIEGEIKHLTLLPAITLEYQLKARFWKTSPFGGALQLMHEWLLANSSMAL